MLYVSFFFSLAFSPCHQSFPAYNQRLSAPSFLLHSQKKLTNAAVQAFSSCKAKPPFHPASSPHPYLDYPITSLFSSSSLSQITRWLQNVHLRTPRIWDLGLHKAHRRFGAVMRHEQPETSGKRRRSYCLAVVRRRYVPQSA